MKLRLNLTPRITLVFVLFAAALLAGVGFLSYSSGRTTLQAAATSELLSSAIQKETALNGWVEERVADLETVAASPTLRADVAQLSAAPDASGERTAHNHVVAELEPSIGPKYLELFVLHPTSGQVLASTKADEEGLSQKDTPSFVSGQSGSFVRNPYLSGKVPEMSLSTPIRTAQGQLLGVLVARLDVDALNTIVRQRTGLRRSDDAFLVNTASQFATQPRFISQPAVLRQTVHSEAVQRCLKRDSGVVTARDYRGTEAIVVYRWLPTRQLGLIVKMDQSEALAPTYTFGRTIFLISGLALLLASALSFGLARSVTRPVLALQAGVARFGRGEADLRLPENSDDEVGLLAREFQQMAASISAKEDQLREGEQRLRLMVESVHDYAILMLDPQGIVATWNAGAQRLKGYCAQEIIGAHFSRFHPPEDVAAGKLEMALAGALSQGRFEDEGWRVRKDGSRFWANVVITPVRGEDGILRGFSKVTRDITERKRAEDEIRQLNEDLEQRVLQRTAQLEAATVEAQSATEVAEEASLAKSQFLANMSHEIRTPMNGVLGPIGLLLDSKLSGQQRELTEIARSSAESLLGIINDILDLSKIEVGKLDIEPIPFNLLLAVEETASMMASRAEEKGLDLIVRFPPDVPRHVVGDPGRIRQVLANLVSNAIKFTPQGHVLINIETSAQTAQEVSLRFNVEDSGIGIAPDKIEHVFGRFNQADTSTTRRYGGTGLGLSISRQLVELMGGQIGAASTVGAGSTFSFSLHLPLQSDAPTLSLPDADLSGVRVLIVDDNAVNRRVLHEQLGNWRIRNQSCAGAEEALQVLRAAHEAGEAFQIAILDHQMPDMDGESLGKFIKADPLLQDTVLVMLTSLGQKGDAMRLKSAGFAAYLLKPARQSELLGALVNVWAARNVQASSELVTRHSIAESQTPPATARRFDGTRVLLVEDNIVNQKVATLILHSFGCRVEVAANGLEALQSIETLPFDIVFMDCEMPEMDGYQATAAIRLRPDAKRDLPIIAVTAKATKGDRERCLQAGMDDYITKPVRSEDFQSALERWAGAAQERRSRGAQEQGRQAEEATGEVPDDVLLFSPAPPLLRSSAAMDAEVVARLRDLAAATDASLLGQIFESFLSDGEARLTTLRGALETGDAETLRKAAHALKGASGNVGAWSMAEISQELQALGESGTVEGAAALIDQLEAELARVRSEIGAELETT